MLELNRVTHYFSGLLAVSDFNLQLARGELVGLIGPNGAGKSTIFNLITGIYRPTVGAVTFHGEDLIGRSPARIAASGIARTFQNIRLFKNLSVFDNVRIAFFPHLGYSALESFLHIGRYYKRERKVRTGAERLLELLDLGEFAGERAASLPYGKQRRLEIARALALQPEILLLDEPAAGMNAAEVAELNGLILRIKDEMKLSVMLIEHQMALVMGISERIIVLDFGKTIASGPPEEIKKNPAVLRAYLGEEPV